MALAKGASAVLLDEPTSGLDPRAAQEFMNLLRGLRAQGKAILMSSHDVFRIQGVADRTGILREGKLVAERSSLELSSTDLQSVYMECTQVRHEDCHDSRIKKPTGGDQRSLKLESR